MNGNTPPTLADLRPNRDSNILQPEIPADRMILDHIHAGQEPTYQKILLGVGAVLATFFAVAMISALMSLIGLTGRGGFVVTGALLLAIALASDRRGSSGVAAKPGTSHRLLGPVLYLSGSVFLVAGLILLTERVWVVPLVLGLHTVLTRFLFNDPLRTGLCLILTLVTVPLICSPMFDSLVPAIWAPPLVSGFYTLLIAATALLAFRSRSLVHLTAELRALIISLSVLMLTFLIRNPFVHPTDSPDPINLYWVGAAVAAGAIALLHQISRDFARHGRQVLLVGTIGAIALAALGAPGIVLALAILALGYHRADPAITGLGAVQIPVFLFLYYYDLQATLLAKSGLLILGGLVLLAGYGWIIHRMRGAQS